MLEVVQRTKIESLAAFQNLSRTFESLISITLGSQQNDNYSRIHASGQSRSFDVK